MAPTIKHIAVDKAEPLLILLKTYSFFFIKKCPKITPIIGIKNPIIDHFILNFKVFNNLLCAC